jgi:hypothetical protein
MVSSISAMKSVSLNVTAVCSMRFGHNATIAAATRPVRTSARRRAIAYTRTIAATPATRFTSTTMPVTPSGKNVCSVTHSSAPSRSG